MLKRTLPILAALTFLLHGGNVAAQCTFNGPGKAKSIKSSLVRSVAGCPSISPAQYSPNSQTGGGTPSCAPPYANSDFEFGPKGSCNLRITADHEEACEDPLEVMPPKPCTLWQASLKCSDIREPGGTTPVSAPGWQLKMTLRATIDDEMNGDMTVLDLPVSFDVTVDNGKLKVQPGPELLASIPIGLPPCSQVQLLDLYLSDPDGNPFAVMGSGTR